MLPSLLHTRLPSAFLVGSGPVTIIGAKCSVMSALPPVHVNAEKEGFLS